MIRILNIIFLIEASSCLYPFESSTRMRISLNGLWDFKVDFDNEGIKSNWQMKVFKTQVGQYILHSICLNTSFF